MITASTYLGRVCPHGHDEGGGSRRYASTHGCVRCGTDQRRRWARENPNKARANQREWKRRNPEKRRAYALRRYRVTPADYDAMLVAQAGRCAICLRPAGADGRAYLSVDHDHETGRVRGLLCHGCNRAIGILGDNPAALERAAAYLRRQS